MTPPPGETYDADEHLPLVCTIWTAGFEPRLRALGVDDVDEAFGRLLESLTIRSMGPNPHNPKRGASVSGWIRMVCRSVFANELDKGRRRAAREVLGGAGDVAQSELVGVRPPLEALLDVFSARPDDKVRQSATDGTLSLDVQNIARRYLETMPQAPASPAALESLFSDLVPSEHGLRGREASVVLMEIAGLSQQEMADTLGVSVRSVQRLLHASHVQTFMARVTDRLFARRAAVLLEAQLEAIESLRYTARVHRGTTLGVQAARAILSDRRWANSGHFQSSAGGARGEGS